MLSDTLRAYLEQCKNQNQSVSSVLDELKKAGWSESDIEHAKSWYSNSPPAVVTEPSAPTIPAPEVLVDPHSSEKPGPSPAITIPYSDVSTPPTKSKKGFVMGLLIVMILLFVSGLSVSGYLVATDKIQVNNSALTSTAKKIVFSIPFVPKTPRYVLETTVLNMKNVKQFSFDITSNIKAKEFQSIINADQLSFTAIGNVDIANPQKITGKVQLKTKDFIDLEMLVKESKNAYLKVNELPKQLYDLLGLENINRSTLDPLLQNWIMTEVTPSKDISPTKFYNQFQIFETEVLPQARMSNDKVDGVDVFKIDFPISAQTLYKMDKDLIGASQSFTTPTALKDFVGTLYVGQKDLYVKKLEVSFVVDNSSSGSASDFTLLPFAQPSNMKISFTIKLSDFNKPVTVTIPSKYLTPEELMQLLVPQANQNTNNAKRQNDVNQLMTSIMAYSAEHNGDLPAGISLTSKGISSTGANICSSLVPTYLLSLPVDPSVQMSIGFTSCSELYDTGYAISRTATNQVTITAPLAEGGTVISESR